MPKEVIYGQVVTVHDGADPAGFAPSAVVERDLVTRLAAELEQLRLRYRTVTRDRDAVLDVCRATRAGYDALIQRDKIMRTFIDDRESDLDVVSAEHVATLNTALTQHSVPVVPPLPSASHVMRGVQRAGQAMNVAIQRVTGASPANWETSIPPNAAADAESRATEPKPEPEPKPDTLPADTHAADEPLDVRTYADPPTSEPEPRSEPRSEPKPRRVQLYVALRWARDEGTVSLGVEGTDVATGRPVPLGGRWLELDWAAANKLIAKTRVARDQANGKPE